MFYEKHTISSFLMSFLDIAYVFHSINSEKAVSHTTCGNYSLNYETYLLFVHVYHKQINSLFCFSRHISSCLCSCSTLRHSALCDACNAHTGSSRPESGGTTAFYLHFSLLHRESCRICAPVSLNLSCC